MTSKLKFDLQRMEAIVKEITFLYGSEAIILQNSKFDPKFDAAFREALGELNRRFIVLRNDIQDSTNAEVS